MNHRLRTRKNTAKQGNAFLLLSNDYVILVQRPALRLHIELIVVLIASTLSQFTGKPMNNYLTRTLHGRDRHLSVLSWITEEGINRCQV